MRSRAETYRAYASPWLYPAGSATRYPATGVQIESANTENFRLRFARLSACQRVNLRSVSCERSIAIGLGIALVPRFFIDSEFARSPGVSRPMSRRCVSSCRSRGTPMSKLTLRLTYGSRRIVDSRGLVDPNRWLTSYLNCFDVASKPRTKRR